MPALDVALATCATLPEPDLDDAPLREALAGVGLTARSLAWDDPGAPFDDARVVLLRSTWNYVHRLDDFLAWVDAVGPRLLNPPALVRWNHHKSYLDDLAARGVATVPTVFAGRGGGESLGGILRARGWADAVAKPAVSAGSFETRRVRDDGADEGWFEAATRARVMMVQPYVRSVDGHGERSIVRIDGAVTHAIRKTPRFAGQHERVSADALAVADDERDFAARAVRAAEAIAGAAALYARVDVVRDDAGGLQLMELELIEPSLFLPQAPAAAGRLAAALARRRAATG